MLNPDQNYSPGGTVTIPGGTVNVPAIVPSGTRVTISSAVPFLQPTDLSNQGGFYPDVINDALDRATILIQQLQNLTSRLMIAPTTDGAGNLIIPNSALRANKYLAFDENGVPIVGTGTVVPNVSYAGNVTLTSNNGNAGTNRDFVFVDYVTEVARLVGSNGRLGIGIAAPTEKLDVFGNIKASGTGAFGGAVSGASGAFVGAVAIGAPSLVGDAMRLNDLIASRRVSLLLTTTNANGQAGSDGTLWNVAIASNTITVTRGTGNTANWRGCMLVWGTTYSFALSQQSTDVIQFSATTGVTAVGALMIAIRSGA